MPSRNDWTSGTDIIVVNTSFGDPSKALMIPCHSAGRFALSFQRGKFRSSGACSVVYA